MIEHSYMYTAFIYSFKGQSNAHMKFWSNKKMLEHRLIFIIERHHENSIFAYAKTKAQISCAVTAQLISAFVFTTHIVQFLLHLYPKFQASSHLLWMHRPFCVRPGWKPRRPVFLLCNSIKVGSSCCYPFL